MKLLKNNDLFSKTIMDPQLSLNYIYLTLHMKITDFNI